MIQRTDPFKRSLQDLHTVELPGSIPEELLYKHYRRASTRSDCKDLLRRISAESPQVRSTHKDLYEIIQGYLAVGDFTRTSPRSSCKDLCEQGLWHSDERFSPGSLQDLLTRNCNKPWLKTFIPGPRRESEKILIPESSKSLPEELSQKHL